jgi:hypothetical protein
MTNFFDELEAQLHNAARAQIAVNRSERRLAGGPARSAVRALPIVVAVSTTIAVSAVALVLLGHKPPSTPPNQPGGSPPPTSGPPAFPHLSHTQRKELVYLDRAQGAVFRADRACGAVPQPLTAPGRKPSLSQGSPPSAVLAILGLLRRPKTPSDRLPPRIIGVPPDQQVYPNGTIPPVKDVYVRYIRYARHRDGANYYIVPASNVNPRPPLPERCYREAHAALLRELPRIPARLRAGTLALEPRYLAYLRASTAPYPGVCLLALNATGNGDGGCGTSASASQIEGGHTLSSGAPGGVPVVYGLAPDGVRSVTFYYGGRYPGHPLSVLVINNVYVLHDPGDRLPGEGLPDKLVWRASSGAAIKTITFPSSG